jgi:hypothetical protein
MIRNKNRIPRYKMKPEVARKLGLTPNKSNKYRLKPETEKQFLMMSQSEGIKRLFFDIETSRFVFLVKDWAVRYDRRLTYEDVVKESKIICLSYKWEHEDKVHNLRWDENLDDKQLLLDFVDIINSADEVIGHNGDRFDIKKTRTRAIYHRIPFRPVIRSLDTLKKARTHFSFPNNRLDTIAKFLGVGAKVKHEGLPMWDKVENGDMEALEQMVKYCDGDVVVLEDVFLVMQNYITHNTHVGVNNGGYKHECPNCGGESSKHIKNNFTATGTIKRLMECNTCSYNYEISNSAYRMMLEMQSMFNKPKV